MFVVFPNVKTKNILKTKASVTLQKNFTILTYFNYSEIYPKTTCFTYKNQYPNNCQKISNVTKTTDVNND